MVSKRVVLVLLLVWAFGITSAGWSPNSPNWGKCINNTPLDYSCLVEPNAKEVNGSSCYLDKCCYYRDCCSTYEKTCEESCEDWDRCDKPRGEYSSNLWN